MGLITGPQKGQSKKLEITQEARHRIVIGLSWDKKDLSRSQKVEQTLRGIDDILFGSIFLFKANSERIFEKMDTAAREATDQNFDLDLSCYAFDKDGNFKNVVDPDAWNAVDESGKIYHSGDDMVGDQGPDDEQIHIEFKDLPEDLNEFFIVVQSDCAHSFKDILNPEVRIADSMTDKNTLQVELDKLENNDQYGFVFCRIFKKEQDWHVQNISEFCEFEQDWPDFLKTNYSK